MTKFMAGDIVLQIEPGGPGEVGDQFTVDITTTDSGGNTYVYFPNPHGGGWDIDRFEKLTPELPLEWRDKIEATLGRDALVTLGVVEPEPAFKVGDRVVFGDLGKAKGSVIEVGSRNSVTVKWDDSLTGTHGGDRLRKVETIKVPKQAIQVQFHVEAGLCPEARASDLRILIAKFLREKVYVVKADSKVTTQVYNYAETREVLPGSQA